jgi:hypothetical protein
MVSAGDYVAVYVQAAQLICYGKINLVAEEKVYVEVAHDAFYEVDPGMVVILPLAVGEGGHPGPRE